MTKTILFRILNLGHWDLFGIWCLEFGTSYFSHALCVFPQDGFHDSLEVFMGIVLDFDLSPFPFR